MVYSFSDFCFWEWCYQTFFVFSKDLRDKFEIFYCFTNVFHITVVLQNCSAYLKKYILAFCLFLTVSEYVICAFRFAGHFEAVPWLFMCVLVKEKKTYFWIHTEWTSLRGFLASPWVKMTSGGISCGDTTGNNNSVCVHLYNYYTLKATCLWERRYSTSYMLNISTCWIYINTCMYFSFFLSFLFS